MVVDRTTEAPDLAASHGSDLRDAGSRLKEEGQALSSSLVDAGKDAAAEARDLGEKAMSSLGSETEAVRDEAAEGLIAFSDALKAASAELSGKRLGFAGDMVEQAAGGLEALARSFEGRSPGEMLEDRALVRATEPGRLHRRIGARGLRARPGRRGRRTGGERDP